MQCMAVVEFAVFSNGFHHWVAIRSRIILGSFRLLPSWGSNRTRIAVDINPFTRLLPQAEATPI